MPDVIDVKDLGSGVIGGTECDHLAFRNKDVDWQIWIAQGDQPYPCRYVITSKQVADGPQYTVQVSNWKAGKEAAANDFGFKAPADAKKVEVKDLKNLKGMSELPSNFSMEVDPMTMLKKFGFLLFVGMMGLQLAGRSHPAVSSLVSTAQAKVGRPLTPVSVAGAARRTARRCAAGVYNC